MKRKIVLIPLAFLLAISLVAVACAPPLNDVIAIVNGEKIERAEFDAYFQQVKTMYEQQGVDLEGEEMREVREGVKEQILDEIIGRRLLLQKAEEQGLIASEEEVQEEYSYLEAQVGEEVLKEQLSRMGMTVEDLKDDIEQQILLDKFIAQYKEEHLDEDELKITEEEVRDLYDQYSEQYDMPEFEEVEAQLKAELQRQKEGQVVANIMQQLREEGEVEILL